MIVFQTRYQCVAIPLSKALSGEAYMTEASSMRYILSFVSSRNPYPSIHRNADMYDLTGFQRDLLYTIAGQDDPHGLAIKDELEEYYEKEIHHGRLYPNLDEIVDKGLVEKGELDQRTNYYTVTARGRRELEARRGWEDQYVDELPSESE